MRLSVIVPVYNVEKFLSRCLNSLLRQGLEGGEYEVVCVNDGSPDNCADILAEYESKYPDVFKVVTQENQGLGEARNTGMNIAKGEWIGFVDPDDYVIDNAYKYILDHFCEDGIDVVHFNGRYINTDGVSLYDLNAKPDGKTIYDGDGVVAYNRQRLTYVWTKVYKRFFLEKHCAHFETPFMEDELFNFTVFLHHPHLRIVSSNLYRYEQGNSHSLMKTTNTAAITKQLKRLLLVMKKMDIYLHEGNGDLVPAAQRNYNTFGVQYYNKMLKAQFTWCEWRECVHPIKQHFIPPMNVSQESSFLGKLIAQLKNWSGQSYVVYIFTSLFLNTVFTPLIRPRIMASYSKKSKNQ